MSDLPGHFCPACGARQKAFLRYPWHFCSACRKRAADSEGRVFAFGNTGAGGGFAFGYADGGPRYECLGVICLIDGRPAYVHEARFGGVVAEPVPDLPFERRGVIDVRRGIPQQVIDGSTYRQSANASDARTD